MKSHRQQNDSERKKKNISIIILALFFSVTTFSSNTQAKVLSFIEVIQENNQWCWAAVSRAVLYYYGRNIEQCIIAEYTRQQANWHDFGSVNCCADPNQGCNYWNYLLGTPGSIVDILDNWGVRSDTFYRNLYKSEVQNTIDDNRVFIIRWAWTSGGGHFVAGYGIEGDMLYYMNPWYGEGYTISDYDWVVSGGNHEWTHSAVMSTAVDIPDYELKIAAGSGGTTNPGPGTYTYPKETHVNVYAIPDIYYQLSVWSGDAEGDDNPLDVNMNSNLFIQANFMLILSPLGFQGEKVLNRSLSQAEYINVLTWANNPNNMNIKKYEIYAEVGQNWQLLGEINVNTYEFRHRNVNKEKTYIYSIVAVTDTDRKGIAAYATVK